MGEPFDHTWFEVNLQDDDDSIRVAHLCGGTMWWFDEPVPAIGDEFFAAFDRLAAPVRETAGWWKNYDMGEFKPVSNRTFGLPRKWLAKDPDRDRSFWAMEAESKYSAGRRTVHYMYHSPNSNFASSNTNFLRQALEWEAMRDEPQRFLEQALEVGEELPFLCGHVGWAVEISRQFRTVAWRTVFPEPRVAKYPGVTLAWEQGGWRLSDFPGVDQVNWLTMVGEKPLAELGGREAVRALVQHDDSVVVHDVRHGLILQAGERPVCGFDGDDLSPYGTVWQALRSQVEPHTNLRGGFDLALSLEEWHETRDSWYGRFARVARS